MIPIPSIVIVVVAIAGVIACSEHENATPSYWEERRDTNRAGNRAHKALKNRSCTFRPREMPYNSYPGVNKHV